MNSLAPAITALHPVAPAWLDQPHVDVTINPTLRCGTFEVIEFPAVVTVYLDDMGEWQVGEMRVEAYRDNVQTTMPVAQDGHGWTMTLPGFFADAIMAELEDPAIVARIEESLEEVARDWVAE